MAKPEFIAIESFREYPPEEMIERANAQQGNHHQFNESLPFYNKDRPLDWHATWCRKVGSSKRFQL